MCHIVANLFRFMSNHFNVFNKFHCYCIVAGLDWMLATSFVEIGNPKSFLSQYCIHRRWSNSKNLKITYDEDFFIHDCFWTQIIVFGRYVLHLKLSIVVIKWTFFPKAELFRIIKFVSHTHLTPFESTLITLSAEYQVMALLYYFGIDSNKFWILLKDRQVMRSFFIGDYGVNVRVTTNHLTIQS